MEAIRQELPTALAKRARKLKSETEPVPGGAATEHAAPVVRVDDAVAEAPRSSTDDAIPEACRSARHVSAQRPAAERVSAEFCLEGSMAETLHRIRAIHGDAEIPV